MSSRPRLDPGSAQLPPHGLSVDAESGRDSRELVACLMVSPRLQDVACGHLRSVYPPRYRSLLEVRGDGAVMDAKFRRESAERLAGLVSGHEGVDLGAAQPALPRPPTRV